MVATLAPWQQPGPIVENPYSHNRTIDPSVGNAYGAQNLGPALPGFTPGSLTPAVKVEIIKNVDAMLLAIWPYDYRVENGVVRLAYQSNRAGIQLDPRVPDAITAWNAANPTDPADICAEEHCNIGYLIPDPIALASPYIEGTSDARYGGSPSPFIDWDYMGMASLEKLYQLWYNFKQMVTAA